MDYDLVPSEEMLFDGTGKVSEFLEIGVGFVHNTLISQALLKPHEKILDIGFGNGKHARALTEYLVDGCYEGLDIVPEAVEWCNRAYSHYPSFNFTHADVYSDWYNPDSKIMPEDYVFPYDDAEFDVAFGVSLFTHLSPDATINYLSEIKRVLKPGGRLLMTCYLKNNQTDILSETQSQSINFTEIDGAHSVVDPSAPSKGVAFTESWLRDKIFTVGLRTNQISYGTWSNNIDLLGALQDTLIAVNPLD